MKWYLKTLSLFLLVFLSSILLNGQSKKTEPGITFFVASDLHFDVPPETDQYYHVVAMNTVGGAYENTPLVWPYIIDSTKTGFRSAGEKIKSPEGVVLTGDITDRAEPEALKLLKTRYEQGTGEKQIHYPVYLGLGNHDLDPKHVEEHGAEYAGQMLAYVAERHNGKNAPVPAENFDTNSFNYSWDWNGVHLIQTHTFAGDTKYGASGSLDWLKKDLKQYASDDKPVIIFQHYGFDKFASEWWTDEDRTALRKVIDGYNVIAIFAGHNHLAEIIDWDGIPVFQVNNAWKDDDGPGSFVVCHVEGEYLEVVTCKVLDDKGNVEFASPFYSNKINPGNK